LYGSEKKFHRFPYYTIRKAVFQDNLLETILLVDVCVIFLFSEDKTPIFITRLKTCPELP